MMATTSASPSPTLPSTAHHVRRPSRTERYENLVNGAKELLEKDDAGLAGSDEGDDITVDWKEAVKNLLGVVDGMSIQLSTHDDLAAQLKIAQSNLTLAETHSEFLEETLRRHSQQLQLQSKNSVPMAASSSLGGAKVGLGLGDTAASAGGWLKRKATGNSPNLSGGIVSPPPAPAPAPPVAAAPPQRPGGPKRSTSFDWGSLISGSSAKENAEDFPSSPTASTRASYSRPFSGTTTLLDGPSDVTSLQKQVAALQNSLTTLHSAHTSLQLSHATLDRKCQELEKTKDDLMDDMERLSIELFEEANKLVRDEREKCAGLETEVANLREELTRARAGSISLGDSDELRKAEEELEEALGLPPSERRSSNVKANTLPPPSTTTSASQSPSLLSSPSFTFRGTSPNLSLHPSPFLSSTSPSLPPPVPSGITSAEMAPSSSSSSSSSRKWFSFATRPSRQVSSDELTPTSTSVATIESQPLQRVESTASSISFASLSSMFGQNATRDKDQVVFNGSRAGHETSTEEDGGSGEGDLDGEREGEGEDGNRTPGTTPTEGSPHSKDDHLRPKSRDLPPPPTPPRVQVAVQPVSPTGIKRNANLSLGGLAPPNIAAKTPLPPSPLDYRGIPPPPLSGSPKSIQKLKPEYFEQPPPAVPTKSPNPNPNYRVASPSSSKRAESPSLSKHSSSPTIASRSPNPSITSSKTPSPSFLSASLFPLPPSPQEQYTFSAGPTHPNGLGDQWTQLAPPADLWTPASPSQASQGFYTPSMGSEEHHEREEILEPAHSSSMERRPSTPTSRSRPAPLDLSQHPGGSNFDRGLPGAPTTNPPFPLHTSPAPLSGGSSTSVQTGSRRASEAVRQSLEDEIAAAKRGSSNTGRWKEKIDAFSSKSTTSSGRSRSPGGRRATVANVAGRSGSLSREQPLPSIASASTSTSRPNYSAPFVANDYIEELIPPGSKVSLPSSLRANMVQKEKEKEKEKLGSYSVKVLTPKPTPPLPSGASPTHSSPTSSRKLSSPSSRQSPSSKAPTVDQSSPTPRRRNYSTPNGSAMLSPEEMEKRKSFRSKGSTAQLLGNFPRGMDLKTKESWEKLVDSLPPVPTPAPSSKGHSPSKEGSKDDLEELMRNIVSMNETLFGSSSEDEGEKKKVGGV